MKRAITWMLGLMLLMGCQVQLQPGGQQQSGSFPFVAEPPAQPVLPPPPVQEPTGLYSGTTCYVYEVDPATGAIAQLAKDDQVYGNQRLEAASPDGTRILTCHGEGGMSRMSAMLTIYDAAKKEFTNLHPTTPEGVVIDEIEWLPGRKEYDFYDNDTLYYTGAVTSREDDGEIITEFHRQGPAFAEGQYELLLQYDMAVVLYDIVRQQFRVLPLQTTLPEGDYNFAIRWLPQRQCWMTVTTRDPNGTFFISAAQVLTIEYFNSLGEPVGATGHTVSGVRDVVFIDGDLYFPYVHYHFDREKRLSIDKTDMLAWDMDLGEAKILGTVPSDPSHPHGEYLFEEENATYSFMFHAQGRMKDILFGYYDVAMDFAFYFLNIKHPDQSFSVPYNDYSHNGWTVGRWPGSCKIYPGNQGDKAIVTATGHSKQDSLEMRWLVYLQSTTDPTDRQLVFQCEYGAGNKYTDDEAFVLGMTDTGKLLLQSDVELIPIAS